MTAGIRDLPEDLKAAVVQAIRSFDAFTSDNDPYEEHDFGAVSVGGERVMFKIEYFDLTGLRHSPDPGNADVTLRIMTVMLADEY